MKGGNYFLACIGLLALASGMLCEDVMGVGNYNVTEMCLLVPIGTKLARLKTCTSYYECRKEGPVAVACDTGIFDESEQACVSKSEDECPLKKSELKTCADETSTDRIANKYVCGRWVECDNGNVEKSGFCAPGRVFKDVKCEIGSCETDFNPCYVVQPGVYFGSTEDCATWQKCTETGDLKTGKCVNANYDVSSGMCDYGKVDCSRVSE